MVAALGAPEAPASGPGIARSRALVRRRARTDGRRIGGEYAAVPARQLNAPRAAEIRPHRIAAIGYEELVLRLPWILVGVLLAVLAVGPLPAQAAPAPVAPPS